MHCEYISYKPAGMVTSCCDCKQKLDYRDEEGRCSFFNT